jgi:SnoaL-like domain
MVTRESVADWVAAYRQAWESNSPSDIATVFSESACYHPSPSEPPWVGIDEIVAGWLEHQDVAGTTSFEWFLVAAEGDTAVIRGVSTYPTTVYDNLWIVRFDADGRAREFTEFWVDRNAPTWA